MAPLVVAALVAAGLFSTGTVIKDKQPVAGAVLQGAGVGALVGGGVGAIAGVPSGLATAMGTSTVAGTVAGAATIGGGAGVLTAGALNYK